MECRLVRPLHNGDLETRDVQRPDRRVAATLAAAIAILIVAFIVLFISIDPLLSDFTSSGAATPASGTPQVEVTATTPAP